MSASSGSAKTFATDHFSAANAAYKSFRPTYPPEFFSAVAALARQCKNDALAATSGTSSGATSSSKSIDLLCVDAGCGHGQASVSLAPFVGTAGAVFAFDPSSAMIQNATPHERVTYFQAPAEDFAAPLRIQLQRSTAGAGAGPAATVAGGGDAAPASASAAEVDLVMSCTAAHWFNLPRFYRDASSVLRPGGVLLLTTYGWPAVASNHKAQKLIFDFSHTQLGSFWPPQIALVTEHYRTLPFPAAYEKNFAKRFGGTTAAAALRSLSADAAAADATAAIRVKFTLAQMMGLMRSWSATERWFASVPEAAAARWQQLADALRDCWAGKGEEQEQIELVLDTRIGIKSISGQDDVSELAAPAIADSESKNSDLTAAAEPASS
jgi:SAM-dependent methyltransferase